MEFYEAPPHRTDRAELPCVALILTMEEGIVRTKLSC
jgi:hypothetical protein